MEDKIESLCNQIGVVLRCRLAELREGGCSDLRLHPEAVLDAATHFTVLPDGGAAPPKSHSALLQTVESEACKRLMAWMFIPSITPSSPAFEQLYAVIMVEFAKNVFSSMSEKTALAILRGMEEGKCKSPSLVQPHIFSGAAVLTMLGAVVAAFPSLVPAALRVGGKYLFNKYAADIGPVVLASNFLASINSWETSIATPQDLMDGAHFREFVRAAKDHSECFAKDKHCEYVHAFALALQEVRESALCASEESSAGLHTPPSPV